MSIGDFFRKIGSGITGGLSWLGHNVIAPASNFLKQVPIVGDVVRAAEPIGNALQKSVDYSNDFYNNVPENKRRSIPTGQDFVNAAKAVPGTISAGVGAASKLTSLAAPLMAGISAAQS
jgi:hypothetical protein